MPSPDRALRRLVVELAALHRDDAASVLDELDAKQRKTVAALLHEFSAFGYDTPEPASEGTQPNVDTTRVSSWLLERMALDEAGARMTAQARATLGACAVRLYPVPNRSSASRRGTPPKGSHRLKSLLSSRHTG